MRFTSYKKLKLELSFPGQHRIILSADMLGEVCQLLNKKRRQ